MKKSNLKTTAIIIAVVAAIAALVWSLVKKPQVEIPADMPYDAYSVSEKEMANSCLYNKSLARCQEKTATIVGNEGYYSYQEASLEKQGRNTFIAEADLEATATAVEASVSTEDKTVVEYTPEMVENAQQKIEAEVAQEVIEMAKEASKADDTQIITVSKATVEAAQEEAVNTVVVEEPTEAPVNEAPVVAESTTTTTVEVNETVVEIAENFTTSEAVNCD